MFRIVEVLNYRIQFRSTDSVKGITLSVNHTVLPVLKKIKRFNWSGSLIFLNYHNVVAHS